MSQPSMPRSVELLSRRTSALLVVDVQPRILSAMDAVRAETLVSSVATLAAGAQILEVPAAATEQYPSGLGGTAPLLLDFVPPPAAKRMFSCRECDAVWLPWSATGRCQIVVAGIETHVCVLQTSLDLLAAGFRVHVAVDAVAARRSLDHDTALRRLESAGATLTTVESVLFEWCETAADPRFKEISQLVKQHSSKGA